jgi:hypothetical protein
MKYGHALVRQPSLRKYDSIQYAMIAWQADNAGEREGTGRQDKQELGVDK